MTGDFNAMSSLFWKHDVEDNEGRVFNNFFISSLEELINEPTHIRDNGFQSCIDLICTDQPHNFTECYNHSIPIYGTLNFLQARHFTNTKYGIIKLLKLT